MLINDKKHLDRIGNGEISICTRKRCIGSENDYLFCG